MSVFNFQPDFVVEPHTGIAYINPTTGTQYTAAEFYALDPSKYAINPTTNMPYINPTTGTPYTSEEFITEINKKQDHKLIAKKAFAPPSVTKGPYSNEIISYTGAKIQTNAALKDTVTKDDLKRYVQIKYGEAQDDIIGDNTNRSRNKDTFRINVVRVIKSNESFYSIYVNYSPIYLYTTTTTTTVSDLIKRDYGINITDENYVNTNNPPTLYARHNIGLCLMFNMAYHGSKFVVSKFLKIQDNNFQQIVLLLLEKFCINTKIPITKIACCALNSNNGKYAFYGFSILTGDGVWRNTFPDSEDEWRSTIIPVRDLNADVYIIDGYSEYHKSKDFIIGGSIEDLFARLIKTKSDDETAGGTRKKKRKTKRKIQRSNRRKYRSQKKH